MTEDRRFVVAAAQPTPEFLNRKATIDECAALQGFGVPDEWFGLASNTLIYKVIGNMVPVYMAYGFGKMYS